LRILPAAKSTGGFPGTQKTDNLPAVSSRFFRVPLEQIGYVRAIFEGYDGVAQLVAPDANRGEIELRIGAGLEDEVDAIARRLYEEAGLIEIARPEDWP
jgi:hypothetical protein